MNLSLVSPFIFLQMEDFMCSRCEADIISLINTVAIVEPQHNDAVNLQYSIIFFFKMVLLNVYCAICFFFVLQ